MLRSLRKQAKNLHKRITSARALRARKDSQNKIDTSPMAMMETLEARQLMSAVMGQAFEDINGNGLRDVGENGRNGIEIQLSAFDAVTGETSLVTTVLTQDVDVNNDSIINPATESGLYIFENVTPGLYEVNHNLPGTEQQTFPVVEHAPRAYLIEVKRNEDVGDWPSAELTAPSANWVDDLAAGVFEFFANGDFLFQFGPSGTAPSRVSFTGYSVVQTDAGDNGSAATEILELEMKGILKSDQHEQGYIGPITMRLALTPDSTGSVEQRDDSDTLADSSFDVFVELELPASLGVSKLHNVDPISFLAREVSRFPIFGSIWEARGEAPPLSFVDENGVEQGQMFFASLTPTTGVDFGVFTLGSISGQKFEDLNGNGILDDGEPGLAGWKVTLQNLGLEVEEEHDDDHGNDDAGGPPPGVGHGPVAPITVYTDANGLYSFTNLRPGIYRVTEEVASPWTQTLPGGPDFEYETQLTSGAALVQNFGNTFTAGLSDFGDLPAGYASASHEVTRDLYLGEAVDAEDDTQADADALGDDKNGRDDDDGVRFSGALVEDDTVTAQITASTAGLLNAWIDFNDDGDFNDVGEQVASDVALSAGVNDLVINVPAGTAGTTTFGRFRFSSVGGLSPSGAASDGEVEDYQLRIFSLGELGTIIGQKFEDVNGDGLHNAGEPGLNGWTIELVDLNTGEVVASTTTADVDHDGTAGITPEFESGIYSFTHIVPGHYEVREVLQDGYKQSHPAGEEGDVRYLLDVQASQTLGALPSITAVQDDGWIASLPAGQDSFFTVAELFLIRATGGHTGGHSGGSEEAGAEESTSEPIRLFVSGQTVWNRADAEDTDDDGTADTANLTFASMNLSGFVVEGSEDEGNEEIVGPVTVTLGLFSSTGTLGPSAHGEEEEAGGVTEGTFELFISIDATALGLGVLTNTRVITLHGDIDRLPSVGSLFELLREGGAGSPTPLKNEAGVDVMRVASVTLRPAFGVDFGNYAYSGVSGVVFDDTDGDGLQDVDELGLPGVTVTLTQVLEEEGDEGHGGSGGQGQGGGGEEEETEPLVFITVTDASGNYSLNELPPGTYVLSEVVIPPWEQTAPGGPDFTYTLTLESGDDVARDFANQFISGQHDYGDAQFSASTSHIVVRGLNLGTIVDSDPAPQGHAQALGDDLDGFDDDDGVVFGAALEGGLTIPVAVTTVGDGKLDAWIDFNGDGDWNDAGEQIFASENVTTGLNNLSFTVPVKVSGGDTFARFRLSSVGGLSPTGIALDGEVEDYQVTIESIPFAAGVPATYTDNDGHLVTVTMTGPGSGLLRFAEGQGNEPYEMLLTNTTNSTTVKVAVANSGETTIGDINVNGSLKSLDAVKVDLLGNLTATGSITTLKLDDVADNHVITIGAPATPSTKTSFTFGRLADVTINSLTPIASLTASDWQDTDLTVDSITAPSMDKLTITGKDTEIVSGNFDANLTLTTGNLGTVSIAGSILSDTWTIAGKANTINAEATDAQWDLTVAGAVSHVHIRTGGLAGNMTAASFGSIVSKTSLNGSITATGANSSGVSIGSIDAGVVSNLDVTADQNITTIKAFSWNDGLVEADAISTLKTVGSVGDPGDFGASLDLNSSASKSKSLSSATIKGALHTAEWEITGNVGTIDAGEIGPIEIDVTGAIDTLMSRGNLSADLTAQRIGTLKAAIDLTGSDINLTLAPGSTKALSTLSVGRTIANTVVRSAGNIGTVKAKSMNGSSIFAGIDPVITTLPDDAPDFTAVASLGSLTLSGFKGTTLPAYVNSNIAASVLGSVSLGRVMADNAGTPFGVAGQTFKTVTYLDEDGVKRVVRLPGDAAATFGDFVVRFL